MFAKQLGNLKDTAPSPQLVEIGGKMTNTMWLNEWEKKLMISCLRFSFMVWASLILTHKNTCKYAHIYNKSFIKLTTMVKRCRFKNMMILIANFPSRARLHDLYFSKKIPWDELQKGRSNLFTLSPVLSPLLIYLFKSLSIFNMIFEPHVGNLLKKTTDN